MAEFTLQTPWGTADRYENLGQGLFVVRTSSHGGYFVPECLLHNIPAHRRADAARWSGSEQWYEEDCCWAYVAEAFPDLFPPAALNVAKDMNQARGL
jgi:hypothetical protein